jgi:plasmid maintenance system killer protein
MIKCLTNQWSQPLCHLRFDYFQALCLSYFYQLFYLPNGVAHLKRYVKEAIITLDIITARRKLEILEGAENLMDLRIPPNNHLEKLSKDRKGQYSIRINDQWRICFEWRGGDAYNVEIVDYH